MVRWVFSDATGHLCFFDCTAGCRVVRPSIQNSVCGINTFRRLPLKPCSALAFSGGWGGYDEGEVTFGTVDGGIFAVSSQWPSPSDKAHPASKEDATYQQNKDNDDGDGINDASFGVKSCHSEANEGVEFRYTTGEAPVLRYASLEYPILLLQMMGVHTPHIKSLHEESGKHDLAWLARNFPGAESNHCCRGVENYLHVNSRGLFFTDRELLAVDKGGNGLVLNWAEDCGPDACSTPAEGEQLRSFTLGKQLSCCCNNPLYQHQLAVASPTSDALLSVFDIESLSFSFNAHCPRESISTAQVVVSCPTPSSEILCSGDEAKARAPVYAEVQSPFHIGQTKRSPTGRCPEKSRSRNCASLCWIPSLGPSLLCAATEDALFLLYDTRVSSFPVYAASTAGVPASSSLFEPGAVSADHVCPIVHLATQPGLVAAHDPMEAAVLPCWCTSCSDCLGEERCARIASSCEHCLKVDEAEKGERCVRGGTSMFPGHRGRLIVKPHGSNRTRKADSKLGQGKVPKYLKCSVRTRLRKRVIDEFNYVEAPSKVRTGVSIDVNKLAGSSAQCAAVHAKVEDRVTNTVGIASLDILQLQKEEMLSPSALVALSADSSSPMTSYPFRTRFCMGDQEGQMQVMLADVVKSWLHNACYTITVSSLANVLRIKHKMSRLLRKHAETQVDELLRSIERHNPASKDDMDGVKGWCKDNRTTRKFLPINRDSCRATEASEIRAAASDSLINTQIVDEVNPVIRALESHDETPLSMFSSHVIGLLHCVDPSFSMDEHARSYLPTLLDEHRENVLKLLEYVSAFCLAFSNNIYTPANSARNKGCCDETAPAHEQLPQQLLSLACKEVAKRIRGLLIHRRKRSIANSFELLVRRAVRDFVSCLRMAFAFPSSDVQPALLFTVPIMFMQLQGKQRTLKSTDTEDSVGDKKRVEQLMKDPFHILKATEVHVQRNCILRMPIADDVYFTLADIQSRSKTQCSSNRQGPPLGNVREDGASYEKARIVCCDTAGNVFVIKVNRSHPPFVEASSECQTSKHDGNCSADTCVTSTDVPFPVLPSLANLGAKSDAASIVFTRDGGNFLTGDRFPQDEAKHCSTKEIQDNYAESYCALDASPREHPAGKICKCMCCSVRYHVQLEHTFRVQRSRVTGHTMCVHSNGCYVFFATRDPFFALYCIDPKLPPYHSWSEDQEIPVVATPLMGIALPPAVLGCDLAPDISPPPLLLSASPLLPSLPVPPSIPPYLVTPPVPPEQLRELKSFDVQQRRAANGNSSSIDQAFNVAWDTRMEFSDWLSEEEVADNQDLVQ